MGQPDFSSYGWHGSTMTSCFGRRPNHFGIAALARATACSAVRMTSARSVIRYWGSLRNRSARATRSVVPKPRWAIGRISPSISSICRSPSSCSALGVDVDGGEAADQRLVTLGAMRQAGDVGRGAGVREVLAGDVVAVAPDRRQIAVPTSATTESRKAGVESVAIMAANGDLAGASFRMSSSCCSTASTFARGWVYPWRTPSRRLVISVSIHFGTARQRVSACARSSGVSSG